mgnify:FL=1
MCSHPSQTRTHTHFASMYGAHVYTQVRGIHLEHQSSTLRLLLTTKFEVLAALQREVRAILAHRTLETQHNFLCRLGLLLEDRLGLTTVTLLLANVTTLTLSKLRRLTGLVLSHLVGACESVSRTSLHIPLSNTYVCFRQVLPLQYVLRVFGMFTIFNKC